MQSSTQSRFARLSALAVGLVAASLSLGCTQQPHCSALGSCGGPVPVGDWALGPNHPSCTEDLFNEPPDTRLVKGDQPAARTTPAEVAFYDWCDLLVTNGGDMVANHEPAFTYDPAAIGAAWARYDAMGHYSAGITRTGTYTVEFPALCMREFGAMDNRPANPKDPASPMGDVCLQLQTQVKATPAHENIRCLPNVPSDPYGCICQFDVSLTKAGSGTYRLKDAHTIVHMVDTQLPDNVPLIDFPQEATFCNKGTSLELTGASGQYLFNEPGLRTLDLGSVNINCMDGAKGPGEDGIDCGAACGTMCPAMPAAPAPAM